MITLSLGLDHPFGPTFTTGNTSFPIEDVGQGEEVPQGEDVSPWGHGAGRPKKASSSLLAHPTPHQD